MKPASTKQTPGHHRCLYLSATGRKCRSWALDARAMFCHRHSEAQPHGPDDFAFHLLNHACNFQNAHGIHDSIRSLYTPLAAGAISPRRAAVLGYLTSLLLRTLPAVYNDPLPEAVLPCPPPSWRNEGKPNPARLRRPRPPHLVSPQRPVLANKAELALKPAPAQGLIPTQKSAPRPPATPTPQSQPPAVSAPPTTTASTPEHLGNGPGRPMPATRAEFAAQVLKYLTSTPSTTTKPNLSTTSIVISPTEKEVSSSFKPPQGTSTIKAPDESISEPASTPVNHSINKKS